MLSLAFKLCPDKHRLNLIGEDVETRIVQVRDALEACFDREPRELRFFDRGSYHGGFTVRANMLFGMVRHNRRHLMPAIDECLIRMSGSGGMAAELMDIGLDAPCGVAGGNLPRVFRQKLLLARALVKNPDILVVDNALTALDRESQRELLQRVCELRDGRNLIWMLSDDGSTDCFDRILRLESGTIQEQVASR